MKILSVVVFTAILVASASARPPQGESSIPSVPLPAVLAGRVDPVINALWTNYDMQTALRHVEFISQFWRTAGNDGFEASIDRVRHRLMESGFSDGRNADRPSFWTDEFANSGHGWQYTVGTLSIVHAAASDEVVLSRDVEQIALCINSFSTPAGGVVAPIVDVGRGDRDEDYATRNVKGAVVIGDADINNLWRRGVVDRGAIGVVSTALGAYVNPNPPGAQVTPRESWDILQWGSVPYDETRKAFGFKATPRAASRLRRAMASDRLMIRVTVQSSFTNKPEHTLVAEIPGKMAPDERVVIVAHVQEPGANDNASGVATLTELVRDLEQGIASGKIPPPGRTLTFLWGDENTASRQWLRDHPDEARKVKYMFSMDMPGEDVRKTGGTFLIERWPDPGAVWERPWDAHTEWGRGNVRADALVGDLISDLHLAICRRVAERSHWSVRTNPYEGGSDHTVFGNAGIPAVLDWHFTDRYYHTNMDTPDKTSPEEMRNVAVSVAATAWLMASADPAIASSVGDLVTKAGQQRIAIEEREGQKLVHSAADPAAAQVLQDTIVKAWRKWYAEAAQSTTRLAIR